LPGLLDIVPRFSYHGNDIPIQVACSKDKHVVEHVESHFEGAGPSDMRRQKSQNFNGCTWVGISLSGRIFPLKSVDHTQYLRNTAGVLKIITLLMFNMSMHM
jgi:hypothetical protein